jgi:hypothetical protein
MVIGTHPPVGTVSADFDLLMWLHAAGHDVSKSIELIAEHHCGLTLADVGSIDASIDQINAMDDAIQFA